jgi:hypothetical protein
MLFAIHLIIIFAAVVAPLVPFTSAVLQGEVLRGIGWGLLWWFLGTTVGTTIAAWDGPPWPHLSLLWRRGG